MKIVRIEQSGAASHIVVIMKSKKDVKKEELTGRDAVEEVCPERARARALARSLSLSVARYLSAFCITHTRLFVFIINTYTCTFTYTVGA